MHSLPPLELLMRVPGGISAKTKSVPHKAVHSSGFPTFGRLSKHVHYAWYLCTSTWGCSVFFLINYFVVVIFGGICLGPALIAIFYNILCIALGIYLLCYTVLLRVDNVLHCMKYRCRDLS